MTSQEAMTEAIFDSVMASATEAGILATSQSSTIPESDKDSDYGGSEGDTGEATTLRMLFMRSQDSDLEFIECCQQVRLLASSQTCSCGSQMTVTSSDCPDGGEWSCSKCGATHGLREGTWVADVRQIRLKDLVTVLYCWSRNYPEPLCQHEMDLREVSFVPIIYKKCQSLTHEYFNDEVSNIGRFGEIVEIEQFQTHSGLHVIGGVERNNLKNVFFRVLPQNWTRDDVVTALADHVTTGAHLRFNDRSLNEILGTSGIRYLEQCWSLIVLPPDPESDTPLVTSLWALFERLISEKDYTQNSLIEFLMRRRMESAKDPFLFLMDVISTLHPPSTS